MMEDGAFLCSLLWFSLSHSLTLTLSLSHSHSLFLSLFPALSIHSIVCVYNDPLLPLQWHLAKDPYSVNVQV